MEEHVVVLAEGAVAEAALAPFELRGLAPDCKQPVKVVPHLWIIHHN